MKRKFIILPVIFALFLIILPACDARGYGSLKAITRPYIAQYECADATYGGESITEKFDYIELILENKRDLLLIYKPKGGDKHSAKGKYTFDAKSRELTADIGVYGVKLKQTTTVKNGRFTISKTIGKKQLIMNFKAK